MKSDRASSILVFISLWFSRTDSWQRGFPITIARQRRRVHYASCPSFVRRCSHEWEASRAQYGALVLQICWSHIFCQMGVLEDHERERQQGGPDADFYQVPRLVYHVDHDLLAQLTEAYKAHLPAGGRLLDLCSSWISHLPRDVEYQHVEGHGMNAAELRCNPQLDGFFLRDLNRDSSLPLRKTEMDAAVCCCGVQYLQYPERVFRELARGLKPGAPVLISFTSDYYEEKVIAGWRDRSMAERAALVQACLEDAGYEGLQTTEIKLAYSRAMMVVSARTPATAVPPPLLRGDGDLTEPKINTARLMGVLAGVRSPWRERFTELAAEAQNMGIPSYGIPEVPTAAPDKAIREAMFDVQRIIASYLSASI